jgi:hypothetical protein
MDFMKSGLQQPFPGTFRITGLSFKGLSFLLLV